MFTFSLHVGVRECNSTDLNRNSTLYRVIWSSLRSSWPSWFVQAMMGDLSGAYNWKTHWQVLLVVVFGTLSSGPLSLEARRWAIAPGSRCLPALRPGSCPQRRLQQRLWWCDAVWEASGGAARPVCRWAVGERSYVINNYCLDIFK